MILSAKRKPKKEEFHTYARILLERDHILSDSIHIRHQYSRLHIHQPDSPQDKDIDKTATHFACSPNSQAEHLSCCCLGIEHQLDMAHSQYCLEQPSMLVHIGKHSQGDSLQFLEGKRHKTDAPHRSKERKQLRWGSAEKVKRGKYQRS